MLKSWLKSGAVCYWQQQQQTFKVCWSASQGSCTRQKLEQPMCSMLLSHRDLVWIYALDIVQVMDDDDDDTKQLGSNCLSLTSFCAYPGRRTSHLCLCVWWAFPNADLWRDDTASVFSSVLLAIPNLPSHILLQFFCVFWTWIVLEGIDITLSRLLSRKTYMQARLSENWVESQSGNPSTREP
jgi:hypothetical protein